MSVKLEWRLLPPTESLLGGTWGDYQRAAYPQYYRKDGQLKWWAKRQLAKNQQRRKEQQQT